jgi:hypothetical protein
MLRYVAPARRLVAIAPLFADYLGEDMRCLMRELKVTIPGHIQRALEDKDAGRVQ